MARFRFNLQSVLDIKEKMETQARQDFSTAVAALGEQEERLAELEQRKADLEQEAVRLLSGNLDFLSIDENKLARQYQDERIAQQKLAVKRAQDQVERARIAMTEAMKERKMYESLREKAFQNFLLEENRAEGKVVDELTSYTYGQKTRSASDNGE